MRTPLFRAILLCVFTTTMAAAIEGQFEREIAKVSIGANRLEVDHLALTGSKPLRYDGERFVGGLEDLRLYRDGEELPHLLISPPAAGEQWIRGRTLAIQITKGESGFEVDLGATRTVDALRLLDLPAPFLKRYRLEAGGDREHWTLLTTEATMFDLPEEGLSLRKIEFTPGDYRYFRVIWDDRASGRLPMPAAADVRLVSKGSRAPVRFRVQFEERPSEPEKSRYLLTLPTASLPARAIILQSSEETLSRPASISEIRFSGGEAIPVELGSSTLRRIERAGAVAEDLRIPIREPEGPELELVIDNGDNPSFRLIRAFVELPSLPWIYFETETGGSFSARWGDPEAKAPRYDLEAKRDRIDPARVPAAQWGELRSAEPALSPRGLPDFEGSAIDRELFTWTKEIPASPPGLTSLLVDAEALAHANDLGDLRIIDDKGRQVPYLVERRNEPLEVPVEIGPRSEMEDGRSRYEIELPWRNLPKGTRLVLETGDRVFDRRIEIVSTTSSRNPDVLAASRWRNAQPSQLPRPLVLDPPLGGHDQIAILVDEGDNAPLSLAGAKLLLPSVRLRFIRKADSSLSLMYGAPLPAPRYDIDMLATHLFGRSSHEIAPGPEQALRDLPSEAEQIRWFWIIVGLAAAVLLLFIGRILR